MCTQFLHHILLKTLVPLPVDCGIFCWQLHSYSKMKMWPSLALPLIFLGSCMLLYYYQYYENEFHSKFDTLWSWNWNFGPSSKLLRFHMPGLATCIQTPNREAWWWQKKEIYYTVQDMFWEDAVYSPHLQLSLGYRHKL
jgi:hypothetical protein